MHWRAIDILKRTRFLLDKSFQYWQLPKIYCSNNQCPKYSEPIEKNQIGKQDLSKIQNLRCPNRNNGQICESELQVYWSRHNTNELKAPHTERAPGRIHL